MSVTLAARPSPLLPRVAARLRTWWIILRISLEERLVYRGEFMLGTLMRFLPTITQIFLWSAVFAGVASAASGSAASGSHGSHQIAGYSYQDMIAYYLLAMIARAFSSMPNLGSGIARSIRDGTIKKFLVQPVDMLGFMLLVRARSWFTTPWRFCRSRWCSTCAAGSL